MKTVALILVILIAFVQYSLWYGKGGWLEIFDLEKATPGSTSIKSEITEPEYYTGSGDH